MQNFNKRKSKIQETPRVYCIKEIHLLPLFPQLLKSDSISKCVFYDICLG